MTRSAYLVGDCEKVLRLIPNSSVAAIITSPPYMALKQYEEGWTWEHYWGLMSSVITESYRVLLPGGWLCINIGMAPKLAEQGETEKVAQSGIPHRLWVMMDDAGFLMDADIIWDKAAPKGRGQWRRWGSYPYPTKIYAQYGHEYILRGRVRGRREVSQETKEASRINERELSDWARGIWQVLPLNRSKEISHPAPFPVEIPYRLVRMHSFVGDVVVDPFAGSAGTQLAAASCGRHSLGVELLGNYWADARRRCGGTEFLGYSSLKRFDDIPDALRYVFDGRDGSCGGTDAECSSSLPAPAPPAAGDFVDDLLSFG